MKFLTKFFIAIILFVLLVAILTVVNQPTLCVQTENQIDILNRDVPTNLSERQNMMREIEKDMKFYNYLCNNNPQQLLIKKFMSQNE